MRKVNKSELKEKDVVYYIASHEDKTMENAERGIVSTVNENGIWVRYTDGETGALTNECDLYK